MTHQHLQVAIKESPTPAPDGTTQIFFCSSEYKAGTVSVWLNGLRLVKAWEDGFEELGGSRIWMNEAPQTGDALHVQYDPA
jgi:hypothetical protein